MIVILRILALSLLLAVIGSLIGRVIALLATPGSPLESLDFSLVLGCIGAVTGVVEGAAGEIVAALNRRMPNDDQVELS
jgi:hypothetical protein